MLVIGARARYGVIFLFGAGGGFCGLRFGLGGEFGCDTAFGGGLG